MKRTTKLILWALAFVLFSVWGTLRRARPLPPHHPPSILVIRLDLMGDVVFTLPAVRAIAEAAPDARITMLVLPYTAELLQDLPYVDEVIAVDVNGWRRPGVWLRGEAFRELWHVLAALRGRRFDLCVSFYGRVAAAFALMSGARLLAGYRSEGYLATFDVGVPGRRYVARKHESEYCLDLARAARACPLPPGTLAGGSRLQQDRAGTHGPAASPAPAGQQDGAPVRRAGACPLPPGRALLAVDPAATVRIDRLLANEGLVPTDRLVALHPGALNMAAKRWLPERWAAVADRIQRELGRRVVLVGSASESPLVDAVARVMETRAAILAGKTGLAELAALVHRCDLLLGGDSGPLHVASALGVPSVSVYGPTDPALTGPMGDHAVVVRSGVDCSPCYDLDGIPKCRRGDNLCMLRVSTDDVLHAVREMLCTSWPLLPTEDE